MKLKVSNKVQGMKKTVQTKEAEKPKKEKKSLPSDEYQPMFKPIRFLVREVPSNKDATKMVKQYIELSVKRFDDDEAQPNLWIQMYQESDFYTGYLKGKCVYLPIEAFGDLLENLDEVDKICEKLGI